MKIIYKFFNNIYPIWRVQNENEKHMQNKYVSEVVYTKGAYNRSNIQKYNFQNGNQELLFFLVFQFCFFLLIFGLNWGRQIVLLVKRKVWNVPNNIIWYLI